MGGLRRPQGWAWGLLVGLVMHASVLGSLAGCESLQRKFARKPKHPAPAPNPVTQFQDYSAGVSPLDLYRKHYLLFNYWHEELLAAIASGSVNLKRVKLTSAQALGELEQLQDLAGDDLAAPFALLVTERAKLDAEIQRGHVDGPRMDRLRRRLEAQGRKMNRDFFWRDVEDQLKPGPAASAEADPLEGGLKPAEGRVVNGQAVPPASP